MRGRLAVLEGGQPLCCVVGQEGVQPLWCVVGQEKVQAFSCVEGQEGAKRRLDPCMRAAPKVMPGLLAHDFWKPPNPSPAACRPPLTPLPPPPYPPSPHHFTPPPHTHTTQTRPPTPARRPPTLCPLCLRPAAACAGKTLLARAVAHHTDCTFIRVSGGELVQKYIGEGSRMVRELFLMAR